MSSFLFILLLQRTLRRYLLTAQLLLVTIFLQVINSLTVNLHMGGRLVASVVGEEGVNIIKYDYVKLIFAFIFNHTIYIYPT